MAEKAIRGDHRLPDLQSMWKPFNVYETLCIVAAGCNSDDAFDHFCSEAVGMDRYKQYFPAWGRPRFDQNK
jgi:hypothetical protein